MSDNIINQARKEMAKEIKRSYSEIMEAFEDETPKIMGVAEVAKRLDWKKQHVTVYLNRAKAKGFPPGMLPEPIQRIASGWLWLASDIEEYAKAKGI